VDSGGESVTFYVPSAEVTAQRVDEGLILVHLQTDQIYELNRTGARFWELCEQGLTRDQILDQMGREFDVDRAELEREVDDLVRALSDAKLLAAESSPGRRQRPVDNS
jgi:hypothetical protein